MGHEDASGAGSYDRQAARIDYVLHSLEERGDRHSQEIVRLTNEQVRNEEQMKAMREQIRALRTERALNRFAIPLASGGLGAAIIQAIVKYVIEQGAL